MAIARGGVIGRIGPATTPECMTGAGAGAGAGGAAGAAATGAGAGAVTAGSVAAGLGAAGFGAGLAAAFGGAGSVFTAGFSDFTGAAFAGVASITGAGFGAAFAAGFAGTAFTAGLAAIFAAAVGAAFGAGLAAGLAAILVSALVFTAAVNDFTALGWGFEDDFAAGLTSGFGVFAALAVAVFFVCTLADFGFGAGADFLPLILAASAIALLAALSSRSLIGLPVCTGRADMPDLGREP